VESGDHYLGGSDKQDRFDNGEGRRKRLAFSIPSRRSHGRLDEGEGRAVQMTTPRYLFSVGRFGFEILGPRGGQPNIQQGNRGIG
jgi:hypothetical protein